MGLLDEGLQKINPAGSAINLPGVFGSAGSAAGAAVDPNRYLEGMGLKGEDVSGPNIPGLYNETQGLINAQKTRFASNPAEYSQFLQQGIGGKQNLLGTLGGQNAATQGASPFSQAVNQKAMNAFNVQAGALKNQADYQGVLKAAQEQQKATDYATSVYNIQRGVNQQIQNLDMQKEIAQAQIISGIIGSAIGAGGAVAGGMYGKGKKSGGGGGQIGFTGETTTADYSGGGGNIA